MSRLHPPRLSGLPATLRFRSSWWWSPTSRSRLRPHWRNAFTAVQRFPSATGVLASRRPYLLAGIVGAYLGMRGQLSVRLMPPVMRSSQPPPGPQPSAAESGRLARPARARSCPGRFLHELWHIARPRPATMVAATMYCHACATQSSGHALLAPGAERNSLATATAATTQKQLQRHRCRSWC